MEQEMSKVLLDFYHKLLQPELAAIKEKQTEHDGKFIDMLGHFDGVHKRLDTLEMEYHSLVGGMNRVEQQQDRLEIKIDGVEDKLGKKIDGVAAELKAHRADTEVHRGVYGVRED